MLFGPFNFYCQAVTDALNERFSVFKEEPFCCFVIFDFRRWPSTSTKTAFEKYGDMELAKILHWYRNIIPEESCIAAKCEWLHFKVAVSDMHASHPNIEPFDLFSAIVKQQQSLHITNICKVLKMMIDMSPSNAHVERVIFALQTIKTDLRSTLSQHTLYNIFRVAHNSEPMNNFNPQPFLNHWLELSKQAGPKKIILEGQKVPSIFRLKSTYSTSCSKA